MGYIEELGKKFRAAGGKFLSEGNTAAQNVAILNTLGMGGFQTISGGGLVSAVRDILPGGGGGTSMLTDIGLDDAAGFLGTIVSGFQSTVPSPTAQDPLLDQLLRGISPALSALGAGQIDTGLSRSIQGKCAPARRKFKIVTDAAGNPTVISVCPPRRMNPLNPRALGRAARRLGSFQRIAAHVEKTIQKACRAKPRARRSTPYCGPRCK